MARQVYDSQDVLVAGTTPTYQVAHVDGFSVPNSSDVLLHVKNGGGSPCTVTIQTPGKVDGLTITAATVSVPATTGDRFIRIPGGFPTAQADGRCYVDFSFLTSVTCAILKLP